MRRVASSWKIIEAVLREHVNSAYKALRAPAAEADIRKLEQFAGTKLPRPLCKSLQIHNGMKAEATLFDDMTLLPAVEIAKWWNITMNNPWDNAGPRFFDRQRIKGDLRWRQRWLPIAVDSGGNLLAVDLDPGNKGSRSQVFAWHNYGDPPPRVIATSYAAWLDAVAEEMVSRRFTLDEFGGIQLRKRLA